MNHGQVRSELFQNRYRCRLIVDEDASLATGRDLAAQDNLSVFGIDAVFFENRVNRGRNHFEHCRNGCLVSAVTHGVGRGFVAQQQS